MARTFFVGGNWKCNGSVKSITDLCASWKESTDNGTKYSGQPVEIVIAPPAIYALTTRDLLPTNFQVSLQNAYIKTGAFTGEIAADMIADTSIPWVIIGHSERRTIFKECDGLVADKTAYSISKGVSVIACIGELLEERESGKTMEVNERQLAAIASKVTDWSKVVIAYEPVWAIGTGKVATPEQAQEVHKFLREWLASNVSSDVAASTRIIYGGSVKPANANELAAQPDIDGFLVGGASLKPDFVTVIDSYSSSA
ncbi:triose-phosphate isomerase [Gracilaria domingensis]|nr:triose-phosphate isomerase [Gracilaria domingensis]